MSKPSKDKRPEVNTGHLQDNDDVITRQERREAWLRQIAKRRGEIAALAKGSTK